MNIFGLQYRRRKQIRDGKHVDVFVNQDIGIPSLSVRLRNRITFNPTARKKITVRGPKGWSWRP